MICKRWSVCFLLTINTVMKWPWVENTVTEIILVHCLSQEMGIISNASVHPQYKTLTIIFYIYVFSRHSLLLVDSHRIFLSTYTTQCQYRHMVSYFNNGLFSTVKQDVLLMSTCLQQFQIEFSSLRIIVYWPIKIPTFDTQR